MGVTHKPKSGVTLTGTEYEAADSHVVAIAHTDLSSVTADQHHNQSHTQSDHTGTGATSTQAFGDAAADGTGTKPANIDHKHGMPSNPFVLGTSPSTQAFGDVAAGGSATDAAKTDHKHGMPANPVAYAAPSLTLGTSNVQGVAASAVRTDATILAFDATTPANVGTAAVGAATVAARRDHVHATGAGTPSTQAMGDSAVTGSGPAAAMTDHKHAMPSLGYGHTGNSSPAVSLTTASAFASATTSVSAATYADVTGVTVTLASGTWLVTAQCTGSSVNAQAIMHVAITDASNVVLSEGSQGIGASGTASVAQLGTVTVTAIVTATGAAIKMRAARGLTTITGTWVAMNGAGTNTTNNLTDGSNKGTGIFAVRIA